MVWGVTNASRLKFRLFIHFWKESYSKSLETQFVYDHAQRVFLLLPMEVHESSFYISKCISLLWHEINFYISVNVFLFSGMRLIFISVTVFLFSGMRLIFISVNV